MRYMIYVRLDCTGTANFQFESIQIPRLTTGSLPPRTLAAVTENQVKSNRVLREVLEEYASTHPSSFN